MSTLWQMDDDTLEAIIAGEPVEVRCEPLVAFVRHLQDVGTQPCPPRSEELIALMKADASVEPAPVAVTPTELLPATTGRARHTSTRISGRRKRMAAAAFAAVTAKAAGLGLAAKIGLGTSVALGGVTTAGATGVLPGPAKEAVRGAIEAISPLEFSDDTDQPARFGGRVSTDATGESDGVPGVHGPDIADEAPGAARRSSTATDAIAKADEAGQGRAPSAPAAPDVAPPGATPPAAVPSTVPDLPDAAQDAPRPQTPAGEPAPPPGVPGPGEAGGHAGAQGPG